MSDNAEKKVLPYPLTIISDRYCGTYSRGYYTAWNLDPQCIPEGQDSDDCGCMDFWFENKIPVGLGDTPEQAIEDLIKKLKD